MGIAAHHPISGRLGSSRRKGARRPDSSRPLVDGYPPMLRIAREPWIPRGLVRPWPISYKATGLLNLSYLGGCAPMSQVGHIHIDISRHHQPWSVVVRRGLGRAQSFLHNRDSANVRMSSRSKNSNSPNSMHSPTSFRPGVRTVRICRHTRVHHLSVIRFRDGPLAREF